MTVAAVMMVKDEVDVVGYTIEHLLTQVDHVYVLDNGSTDGTRDLLRYCPDRVTVEDDPEVGYWQSRKTTELAARALQDGHRWAVPVDADELWTTDDGRTIRDLLLGQTPDVQLVKAVMWHYLPTGHDDLAEPDPFRRIGWRLPAPGALPKVACRTSPRLVIHAGNHGADTDPADGHLTAGGLTIRHYSWRSKEQYVKKIVNGAAAYRATDLPDDVGAHWRMFGPSPDADRIAAHFDRHFWRRDPHADGLVYDPAPR